MCGGSGTHRHEIVGTPLSFAPSSPSSLSASSPSTPPRRPAPPRPSSTPHCQRCSWSVSRASSSASAARALAERGRLPPPLPHVRLARWVLDPRSSWITWRAHALGGAATARHEAATAPSGPVERAPAPGPKRLDRRAPVAATLREDPTLTVAGLATTLAGQGIKVSLRTAQRLRAERLERT